MKGRLRDYWLNRAYWLPLWRHRIWAFFHPEEDREQREAAVEGLLRWYKNIGIVQRSAWGRKDTTNSAPK